MILNKHRILTIDKTESSPTTGLGFRLSSTMDDVCEKQNPQA
ncbi:MAG: hypothetical protein ACJATI_003733 [Halioglobus sp.]|jgi:hypothetical protein